MPTPPPSAITLAAGIALLVATGAPSAARAQRATPSAADSALVFRVLAAEDAREPTAAALAQAAAHPDPRIRDIGRRAAARIADAAFTARDRFAPAGAPPPRVWPEPDWKPRFRALGRSAGDCERVAAALGDAALPVRLRALDLVDGGCATRRDVRDSLPRWVDALPTGAAWRDTGTTRWHLAARALYALAALDPAAASPRVAALATHPHPEVRAWTARAAARLGDTATLRRLLDVATARLRADGDVRAAAGDANVAEVAVTALARLTGHADDARFLRLLAPPHAAPARAAAVALAGSPAARTAGDAAEAFAAWVAVENASARDVRTALLALTGRSSRDDRPPTARPPLPPDAVPLALGADVRLRVARAAEHGGGAFTVRLRGDAAPIMAARILALVRDGWYDGTAWHRVEHDFVIQGGSPAANEYVGLPYFLVDELGTIPHPRGTVGMSTRGHDTGDAQWFVNLRDNARLTRDYTVFAEVTDGMDVVDAILEGDRIARITVVP